ncbi:hypothetical protein OG785_23715 [Streptomyces sp. NBC_00006]|uniref:hypothetical protein n=1 Tax=unclassified Streptomyces TaxID=2593676 RepID=UPI00225128C6|nr:MULTISPECIES: hypothetical protein [unclassified Streptomyces]MCX4832568.1 hypothetical protein [Streptomyces sp. NBC_01016]MCX5533547.1 hypothetical protein [Streptomyces sp. NBC_00006]
MTAEFLNLHCDTCHGGPRPFRRLKAHEKAHLAAKGQIEADIHATWRCDTEGCLTYRRHGRTWGGGSFPPSIDD